jgi:alpha-1,3-mannosyltransferase
MPDRASLESLPRLDIMAVPVVAAGGAAVVAALDEAAADAAHPVLVAYLNAHGSNLAAHDPEFLRALQEATVLNDGVGLDIAARWLHGRSFPENLNGTDFTVRFLRESGRNWRVYWLGAKPGVAEAAAQATHARLARHSMAGVRDGYFSSEEQAEVANAIREAGADLLLVAMGNPRQELWMREFGAATGCKLIFGVGALFDFLSGQVSRAPRWVRALRMEWAYRLALEPRRLARRYLLGNPYFLARALRARLERRTR